MNKPVPRQRTATASPRGGPMLAAEIASRLRRTLAAAFEQLGTSDGGDQPALTIGRAALPVAPTRLAASHPAVQRVNARTLYERCLAHYRGALRPQEHGLGIDDVGAAAARFVAVNLEALHGVHATPEQLLRLERQLAAIVRGSSTWTAAGARERQGYFEELAILAVVIGESSAQAAIQGAAAVATVRRAARGYLQQLLGIDADLLHLGPNGLTLRTAD